MMQAVALRKADRQLDIHIQAWATEAATAKKEVGSGKGRKIVSVYENFKDFYDHEEVLKQAWADGVEEIEDPRKAQQEEFLNLILKANQE